MREYMCVYVYGPCMLRSTHTHVYTSQKHLTSKKISPTLVKHGWLSTGHGLKLSVTNQI